MTEQITLTCIKRAAKQIERQSRFDHAKALDEAARRAGFAKYDDALKALAADAAFAALAKR